MIKNIVLDMGNVCCKWDVSYIASQLASSLEEKDYIIKHLFQTKQWAQLDQGVLSLQDAKKQLIEQIPDEKRDLIFSICTAATELFEPFIPCILKKTFSANMVTPTNPYAPPFAISWDAE